MNKTANSDEDDSNALSNEPFMQRFNRRKREASLAQVEAAQAHLPETADERVEEAVLLTDDDMPSIESLTADSDFTPFMSPKVSDALRKLALRKLFHSAEFNFISELDEYAEDFTSFAPLGDILTADMRHQLEVEAKRKLEQALNSDSEELASEECGGEPINMIEQGDQAVIENADFDIDDVDVESDCQ